MFQRFLPNCSCDEKFVPLQNMHSMLRWKNVLIEKRKCPYKMIKGAWMQTIAMALIKNYN